MSRSSNNDVFHHFGIPICLLICQLDCHILDVAESMPTKAKALHIALANHQRPQDNNPCHIACQIDPTAKTLKQRNSLSRQDIFDSLRTIQASY